jgi:disulfide bond formation protein DsbB
MKRKMILLMITMALGVLLAACGESGPKYSAEDIAAGKTLFAGTCAACHGPDAKGLPNLGKDMTTSEFIDAQSDEELLAFIKTGRGPSDPLNTTGIDMPAKGGNPALSDEDINLIIAYIRSVQGE